MRIRRFVILALMLLVAVGSASAKYKFKFHPYKTRLNEKGDTLVYCVVSHGDTMPVYEITQYWVYPVRKMTKKEEKKYWRMVADVKRALPVVDYIEKVMIQTNDTLMRMPTKKERDKYMAHFEKKLYKENYDEMSQLTLRQGMLVMRLLDRDLNETSYQLIKAYRGRFRAGFYQLFAKLLGADLKTKFGDAKDDPIYEEIINKVESGQL